MSSWDNFIPHRLVLNKSLLKESEKLRHEIESYQTTYNDKIAEFEAMLTKASEEKDVEYARIQKSIIEEFTNYSDFLNAVGLNLSSYIEAFYMKKLHIRMVEIIERKLAFLHEERNFLYQKMRLIGDEVEVLEKRKQELETLVNADDVIKLCQQSGSPLSLNQSDNASTIIRKVSEKLKNGDYASEIEKSAMLRLYTFMKERSEYSALITYIDWVIQQKINCSKDLKSQSKELDAEEEKNQNQKKRQLQCIRDVQRQMQETARVVREYWMKPVTYLNADIAYAKKQKIEYFDKLHDIDDQIQELRDRHSSNQYLWEDLHDKKSTLRKKIEHAKSAISSAVQKRQDWYEKENFVIGICKKYSCQLLLPQRNAQTDEERIIDERLTEIEEIRVLGIKEAEDRYNTLVQQINIKYEKEHEERLRRIELLKNKQVKLKKEFEESQYKVENAERLVEKCRKNDHRFFISKLLSKDTETIKAESIVKQRRKELSLCEVKFKKVNVDYEILQKSDESAEKQYETELRLCHPVYSRPTAAERLEEEKLNSRKEAICESKKRKNRHGDKN